MNMIQMSNTPSLSKSERYSYGNALIEHKSGDLDVMSIGTPYTLTKLILNY